MEPSFHVHSVYTECTSDPGAIAIGGEEEATLTLTNVTKLQCRLLA